MQQKVQFVTTVVHEPRLLIFDEPFSGFDPVNAEGTQARDPCPPGQGDDPIFSTHNMQSVEELSDDITLNPLRQVVPLGSDSWRYAEHTALTARVV